MYTNCKFEGYFIGHKCFSILSGRCCSGNHNISEPSRNPSMLWE